MKIMDNKIKYILYLPVLIIGFYLTGCSDLETDINQPPQVSLHKEGILAPSNENFHGNLISNNKWNMDLCKDCHGVKYDGGLVKVSCLTCHNQPAGPENCTTCHGSNVSPAPPNDLNGNVSTTDRGVGAHQVHLTGSSFMFRMP